MSEIQQVVLSDDERLALEIFGGSQADGTEYRPQPLRVKMPSGGSAAFVVGDQGDTWKTFDAVPVIARLRRAYWPGNTSMGTPPLCSSADAKFGVFNWDDGAQIAIVEALAGQKKVIHPALGAIGAEHKPGHFECASCPLAKFGSSHREDGARSQACKLSYAVVLWNPDWPQPAILNIPPSSLKAWDTFANLVPRQWKGWAYWGAMAKFGLSLQKSKSGISYAVLDVQPVSKLPLETVIKIKEFREQYADYLRGMGYEPDVDEVTSGPDDSKPF